MTFSDKVAVIDLDDTLNGLRFVLMDYLNRIAGRSENWLDWRQLDVEHIYGITDAQFLEIAAEKKLLEKARPNEETASFMRKLKDAGLSTTVLTARAWHPRAEEMTKNWFNLYDIPFDDIVACHLHEDKADYIRHMDNVLFTIDDSPRHCNSYANMKSNRPDFVFAYEMPWNIGAVEASVISIKNLNHIEQHIEGL